MSPTTTHDASVSPECRYPLPSTPIPRIATTRREEFAATYMSGLGMPVIVSDGMRGWAAKGKWTFDFFRERYGAEQVVVSDRLFHAQVVRRIALADFLTYSQFPFATKLAGISEHSMYLTGYSPFTKHPELMEDFSDPYFVENSYRTLEGPLANWYNDGFSWVFIGPRGTWSPLHIDLFGTHAWLAQITGRKRILLFSPSDNSRLYNGEVNLIAPDLEKHPKLAEARPYEGILEPGDVIFIPGGWPHDVVSLEASISLTANFVGPSNFISHLMAICRDLPGWVNKIDTPDFREMNRIRWRSNGFTTE